MTDPHLTEQQSSSFTEALQRANLLDRDDFVVLFWHDTIGKPWHEVARAAADEAVRIGAGILVVDTLGQFASLKGDAENNAGAALEAIRPLQEAATRGLAVILVRHDRKGGGQVGESGRGSSAFAGAVDIIVAIRRGDGKLARFERAKTAERTRRGRLRKAREGKVIAGRQADYGFRYNAARDGYTVHEGEMKVVRRIFRRIAEGSSVNGARTALEAAKVPPPRGVHWQRTFIRECIFDDVYKPHSIEEVASLVSPQHLVVQPTRRAAHARTR